jgi:PAS domain S-box-containing protein
VAAGLGAYVFVVGLVSFLGYVLDAPRLTDWDHSGISIQPNATIAAMGAGAALVLLVWGRQRASFVVAFVPALLGSLTLFEWLSHVNVGIDGLLLFERTWGRRGVVVPGRMGPPGSTAWTLLGVGLVLAHRGVRARQTAAALGLAACGIAALSLIGYIYRVDTLYTLPRLTIIALQTSTMVLAAGLGLMVALPRCAPVRAFLADSAAGVLVRRSLPLVIGIPIVGGWLRLRGEAAGLYDTPMGTALLVCSLIVLTSLVLVWGASAVAMRERALLAVDVARVRADMILGAARDQFVVVDAAWRYTYVNDRVGEVTGLPREALLGRTLWELWPAVQGTPLEAAARRVMETREATTVEYYYALWERWFDIRLHPTMEGGLAFFVLEITDRKRAEEALEEVRRRKDAFLATLAHELRNPLAPIRGAVEVMRQAGNDVVSLEVARDIIDRQSGQMVRLIDDLMDISRITRDTLVLKRELAPLAPILEQAVEICRPLADAAQHELTVRVPAEPLLVDADTARLVQVFGNLLTNACKFTPRRGRIDLVVRREDRDLQVSIRDTGVGIAADMLPRIFELFTQVSPALERSAGLGIGLALAKRLVELHGGSLTAQSAGVGLGSTFAVRLPLPVAAPRSSQAVPLEAARLPDSMRRVLIVEDNADLATMVAEQLRRIGGETWIAHEGREAVTLAAASHPDVILLDLGLPGLNGFEVCRTIRRQPWGTSIVIIAMTGWGQDTYRQRSLEAGFNGHLVKPVALADLLRVLAAFPASPRA